MRYWWQLGIRNWRVKPGRTAASLAAIALGVGVVIWVTCAYESVRLAVQDQVWFWIGRSHLSVESVYGPAGTVYQIISKEATSDPNVEHVTYRLQQNMMLHVVRDSSHDTSADRKVPDELTSLDDPLQRGRAESELPAAATSGDFFIEWAGEQVQAVGIDPTTEYSFREYEQDRVAGRLLTTDDTEAAVMDDKLAARLGVTLGDRFVLRSNTMTSSSGVTDREATFTIVGLLEYRQVAKQQRPVVMLMLDRLQWLVGYDKEPKRVTKIDIMLKDTSNKAMRLSRALLWAKAKRHRQGFLVTSASAKLRQVEAAEKQTGFVLLLISTVALFTAFFIILSTLSMGMVERVGQLGMLRCLGMTRWQMAFLVLSEAVPLCFLGIVLGVPVGLALARLSVALAPEYVGTFAVSRIGLLLAFAGGGVTTLAGALLPMVQAMRVSPLAASRPQSQATPSIFAWLSAIIGVGMIVGHSYMIHHVPPPRWFEPSVALSGVALLFCGYAMVTPALVMLFSQVAVRFVAMTLRLRYRLLGDQVGRAAWRSAAICCGLMVGLSLIVSLVVHSDSLARGWDFPKDFCEAFVFVTPPVPQARVEETRQLGGVATSCVINEGIRCTVYGKGLFNFPVSRFVAGDPDEFFRIAKLEFVEGDKDEAIAKLKKGGAVLVTPEFTRAHKVGYGEQVRVRASDFGRVGVFEIAGVVTSPALDIAANYFNAGGMLVQASVHIVMGTLADARRVFGVPDEVSMFLINFDLPTTTPLYPAAFEQDVPPRIDDAATMAKLLIDWRAMMPERSEEITEIKKRCDRLVEQGLSVEWAYVPALRLFRDTLVQVVSPKWGKLSAQQLWQTYREELVMQLLARRARAHGEQHASVRALKLQIDRDLRRATMLFATIPMVALIVAALGVGNLMMANITSRIRQIAMLRAIGTTRWQVIRLVIGEAAVLGALGSVLGVSLGLHAASGLNTMTQAIWGYEPKWTIPWDLVLPGIAFTVAVCLIAGIVPALRAARSNVIDALQTT